MNYYNKHVKEYIEKTIGTDMSELYKPFEEQIKTNGKILDVGFGSGRDSLYFQNKGFEVISIDPVKEFCENAIKCGLTNVFQLSIEDINYNNEFDGIWASASLLHLEVNKLDNVFNVCYNALKDNGVFYFSFKLGDFKGVIDGRYFTYLTEKEVKEVLDKTKFKVIKLWISEDKLNRDVEWINGILKK